MNHHVWSTSWNPDGTMLASGSEDKSVKIWNTKNGNRIQSIPDPGPLIDNYRQMPEIDLSSLPEAIKESVLYQANREKCTCGCSLTISGCRNNDTVCRTSVKQATDLINSVKKEGELPLLPSELPKKSNNRPPSID
jgi:WD40 repeat protein